jgi:hypothetical protein
MTHPLLTPENEPQVKAKFQAMRRLTKMDLAYDDDCVFDDAHGKLLDFHDAPYGSAEEAAAFEAWLAAPLPLAAYN